MAFATRLRPALTIYLGTRTQHFTSLKYAELFTKSQVQYGLTLGRNCVFVFSNTRFLYNTAKTENLFRSSAFSVNLNYIFQGIILVHLGTLYKYPSFLQLNENKHRNILPKIKYLYNFIRL